MTYAFVTVTVELVLGLASRFFCKSARGSTTSSPSCCLMPLMTAPALAALMWKLMTNPGFGILSYFATLVGH
jgi:multiple sugar transport system permease protein